MDIVAKGFCFESIHIWCIVPHENYVVFSSNFQKNKIKSLPILHPFSDKFLTCFGLHKHLFILKCYCFKSENKKIPRIATKILRMPKWIFG
jgi:hypothetical protein